MTNNIQLTLAIIKPHVVKVPAALQNINNLIISSGFYVILTKKKHLTINDAEMFYEEHRNKFFYNRLVTLMSSDPSHIHILGRENAIQAWRDIMGPTKVYKTQFTHPETIRGIYGLSDTRNAVHGSDSEESADREIKFFFPDFDTAKWRKKLLEVVTSKDKIVFDVNKFVHLIYT